MPGRKASVVTLWRVSSSVPATSTATSLGDHRLESMEKGGERTSHLPWSHLSLAWVLKVSTPKLQDDGVALDVARSLHEIVANAAFGPLPGWAILLGVIAFYCWLAYAALLAGDSDKKEHGEVHV